MKKWILVLTALTSITGLFNTQALASDKFDHSKWNNQLNQNIVVLNNGQATQVDYQAFFDDRVSLKAYLNELANISQSEFDAWSNDEQLAFLINAYNAWTVEFILTAWPDIDSIKDLGSMFSSPWNKEIVNLLGQTRTLNDIEHNLIRGSDRYNDPRIHFAVNCASIGCPALANKAFTGENVDALLEEQTKLFLSDNTRNRLSGSKLELSSIFKWYGEDFEKGWKGFYTLESFILKYSNELNLTKDAISKLESEKLKIKYLKYDWNLNKVK